MCHYFVRFIINSLLCQVVEERYEDQVELVAAILQHTVSEQSEQSSGVLDAVASFLDGVAKVALDSNESIPVEVVEGVLESLSSLQQWQPHLLNTSSTSIARWSPLCLTDCCSTSLPLFPPLSLAMHAGSQAHLSRVQPTSLSSSSPPRFSTSPFLTK